MTIATILRYSQDRFFCTAVVLQIPWKQCSEWTGWTNQANVTREDGQGNTPNNPMESLPDSFESAGSKVL
jgi:hypothetical protein